MRVARSLRQRGCAGISGGDEQLWRVARGIDDTLQAFLLYQRRNEWRRWPRCAEEVDRLTASYEASTASLPRSVGAGCFWLAVDDWQARALKKRTAKQTN